MAIDDPKRRQPAADEPDIDTKIATAVATAMEPLVKALGAIVANQQSGQHDMVKAARGSKRPESYLGDFEEPKGNHWSPDGTPLIKLECPTYMGVIEFDEGTGERKIVPTYPYLDDERGGLTQEERQLLNSIKAGVYDEIERIDGLKAQIQVQVRIDTSGNPYMKVIAMPKRWQSKQEKNSIGGVRFLRQLAEKSKAREMVAA